MDIVQRLRDADWNDNNELFSMAADEITKLRKQLSELESSIAPWRELQAENKTSKCICGDR